MQPYYQSGNVTLYHGDCRDVLPTLEAESFTACVTDPPYGLNFMGEAWDHGVPGVEFWEAVKRVLAPGAPLLAFSGTRTFHRQWCAIEDAEFEIRDTLSWMYGSGFPKNHNLAKAIDRAGGVTEWSETRPNPAARPGNGDGQKTSGSWRKPKRPAKVVVETEEAKKWVGQGTVLKPAWEPICLAMKPLGGTFAENALEHGVAGLNIDGTRLAPGEGGDRSGEASAGARYTDRGGTNYAAKPGPRGGSSKGRWPANVVLDRAAAEMLDAQSGVRVAGSSVTGSEPSDPAKHAYGDYSRNTAFDSYADTGGASRFFYTSKASKADRNAGLPPGMENTHPTVKPTDLVGWLVRMVEMPERNLILDPFAGSGTLGYVCHEMGLPCVLIEQSEASCELIAQRFTQGNLFSQ